MGRGTGGTGTGIPISIHLTAVRCVCWLTDVTATRQCTSGAELLRYTTSQQHAGVPQERSCSDTRRHSNMLVYLRSGAAQMHDVTATCWCTSGAELLRYTTSQQHAGVSQERSCSDTRRHSNMLVYLRSGAAQIHDVTATCWCISGAELLRQLYMLPHGDRS